MVRPSQCNIFCEGLLCFKGFRSRTPIQPDLVTKKFKKVARRLGMGEYRFHDLRHTHATLLLKTDVHPKVVKERLGHSSINMTLDTYYHVIPSMQKEAVQKLKNAFS